MRNFYSAQPKFSAFDELMKIRSQTNPVRHGD
jgi:hypothetical protein